MTRRMTWDSFIDWPETKDSSFYHMAVCRPLVVLKCRALVMCCKQMVFMNRLVLMLLSLAVFCRSGIAGGATVDVLVPAYANPCCGGGPDMWTKLIASASDPQRHFELNAVFNPASGPGVGRDPNYLDAAGDGVLARFVAAGGVARGYVATGNATRALSAVKADVDAYLTGQYAGFIDGIFFDEMSNNLADVGYYRELNSYVKSIRPNARTFGNPGLPFINNPTNQATFTAADYISSMDTIVSFENTGSAYLNAYQSFPYLEGLGPRKIAHIVHSQADWDAGLIAQAAARGAGYLYVTDDLFLPNPYDALTSYWPRFTADVAAFNARQASVVPEPVSSGLMLLGLGLVMMLWQAGTTRRMRFWRSRQG